jgi:hypothetical protein
MVIILGIGTSTVVVINLDGNFHKRSQSCPYPRDTSSSFSGSISFFGTTPSVIKIIKKKKKKIVKNNNSNNSTSNIFYIYYLYEYYDNQ